MGALRGNVYTVIIPEKNRKELTEIPANVKRKLKFITVGNMDEVLAVALKTEGRQKPAARRKKPAAKSGRRPKKAVPAKD